MVIDCFPFFQELDLLEIRLNVLKDVVDKFIVLESDYTHSGNYKGYIFKEHRKRFELFPIEYYELDFGPHLRSENSWDREHHHRRCLYQCIQDDLKVDDVVILSDVDEIPRPRLIKERKFGRYVQDLYYFYLNGYADQEWTSGTVVMPGEAAMAKDWQYIRMDKSIPEIENGGWHFSSVGIEEDVEAKMRSFAHTEYDSGEALNKVMENYRNLKGIHGESLILESIEMLPSYILKNAKKYSHLFYHAV